MKRFSKIISIVMFVSLGVPAYASVDSFMSSLWQGVKRHPFAAGLATAGTLFGAYNVYKSNVYWLNAVDKSCEILQHDFDVLNELRLQMRSHTIDAKNSKARFDITYKKVGRDKAINCIRVGSHTSAVKLNIASMQVRIAEYWKQRINSLHSLSDAQKKDIIDLMNVDVEKGFAAVQHGTIGSIRAAVKARAEFAAKLHPFYIETRDSLKKNEALCKACNKNKINRAARSKVAASLGCMAGSLAAGLWYIFKK